jgi:hypothetical protein
MYAICNTRPKFVLPCHLENKFTSLESGRGQFVFSPESSRKPHKYQATQQRIALFTAECAAEQNQLDVGVQFFSVHQSAVFLCS